MRRARRLNLVLALLLAAATLPIAAVATTAEPAAAQSFPCGNPQPADLQLLLPAWGDLAGWASPTQYETILTADIDGDGTKELLGRNAQGMEVYTWGQPYQAAASANAGWDVSGLPAPGQWLPMGVAGPAMSEVDGFWDPSVYTTLRAANIDADPAEELIARTYAGLAVYQYTPGPNGSPGSWSTTVTPGVMADDAGSPTDPGASWWLPQYYSTIMTGDVDGDGPAEVLGRGPTGIETFKWNGSQLVQIDGGSRIFTDNTGWNAPDRYATLRLANIDGDSDGKEEIVARGQNGLVVVSFNAGTWSGISPDDGPWPDAGVSPWTNTPSWYTTIDTADLNGDGRADVYGRTQYGIDAWTLTAGGTWQELVTPAPSAATPSILTDAQTFNQPQYYATIQPSTIDGTGTPGNPAFLMARSSAGVAFYQLGANGQFGTPVLADTQFSDANGWDQAVRYSTLTTSTIAPGLDLVLGKDATGMRQFQLSGGAPNGGWISPSASFPAWSDDEPVQPPGYPSDLWTQQTAAYTYLNQWWQTNGGTTSSPNIRDSMTSTTFLMSTPNGIATTLVSLENIDPPTGQNIPQDVWDGVYYQVWGWLYQAGNIQQFLFNTTASMNQLITDAQIVAAGDNASDIATAYFAGQSQSVEAVILNLLRVIAIVAAGAISGPVAGATGAGLTLLGAAMAASSALKDNPTGAINQTAENLDGALNCSFTTALEFLTTAYGQLIDDAGLLGAMGQMTIQGPLVFQDVSNTRPVAMDFNQTLTFVTNQRYVWTWQQLAAGSGSGGSGGWKVGYCADMKVGPGPGPGNTTESCDDGFRSRVSDGYGIAYQMNDTCVPGIDDGPCTYGYQYRVLNGSCKGSDTKGDEAWKALINKNVGFIPETLFMPRVPISRVYNQSPANSPSGVYEGGNSFAGPIPINADGTLNNSGRLGILGWRVLGESCN